MSVSFGYINRDNLSGKKKPDFVINTKIILRSSDMNNKKIILIILSVLVFTFISCKSNEEPTKFKPSQLGGTWQSQVDANTSFVLNADTGTITVNSLAAIQIDGWAANKDTEYSEFKVVVIVPNYLQGQSATLNLTFKSTTECDVSIEGVDGVEPFKKQ